MKIITLKNQFFIFLLVLICNTTIAQWTAVTPTTPLTRYRGQTFVLGDTAYYFGGSPGYQYNGYSFVPGVNSSWTQQPTGTFTIANIPSTGSDVPFTFVIKDVAYLGGGANGGSRYNQFYQYNQNTGTWTNKASFIGSSAIVYAVSFSIGNYGYAGTGANGGAPGLNDFCRYDPAVDTWTVVASIPGARFGAVGFSDGTYGYVGLGLSVCDGSTLPYNDMYRYDPASSPPLGTWTAMASMPNQQGGEEAAYFVLCNKLIVTLGDTINNCGGNKNTPQTWMFDPTDGPVGKWSRLPDFPGTVAYCARGFAIGNTGYVEGGTDINTGVTTSQLWSYTPTLISVSATNVTICSGTNTLLSANGSSLYKWSPASGLSSTVTTSSSVPGGTTQTIASPLVTTTYTVTEAICGQYTSVTVNVLPSPTINTSGNTTICSGSTTNVSAFGGSVISYLWNTGATTDNINVSPASTAIYNVSAGNGLCSANGSVRVSVPVINISSHNATVCSGSSASLSASGGDSYLWSTGSTAPSITVHPSSVSSYSLTGTVGICSVSASYTVAVYPLPVISIGGNTSICGGSNSTLSASGGTKYLWSTGATVNNISINPTGNTSYTVIVTSALGCTDSSSVMVTLLPVIALANSQTICSGSTAQLSATGGSIYLWNTGATNNFITVNPTSTTNYTVTVSDGNCNNSAGTIVVVNPLPNATACCNATVISGQAVSLAVNPANTNNNYSWTPDTELTSNTIYNPMANPTKTTEYYVTLTDSNGCQKKDSVWVIVNIICKDIFVPDGFSPNGDLINDVLYIKTENNNCIQSMVFNIFDRWGNKVFSSIDPAVGWNGYFNNKLMDLAVFVYSLQATLIDGSSINKKGNVSLVK